MIPHVDPSSARPIHTYEGRACSKKGVKADMHGIIHDARKRPQLVNREPRLGFPPVRANMVENESLAIESRVNYSKPSTIEHNSGVKHIGDVHNDDLLNVKDAHDTCWESSLHGSHSRNGHSKKKGKARQY